MTSAMIYGDLMDTTRGGASVVWLQFLRPQTQTSARRGNGCHIYPCEVLAGILCTVFDCPYDV